ncbi:MAG TPA: hypothetical protein VME42_03830 [Steroidobacteraceae bacterium]|nr:hypothetical protein [Steroidobacteraceae bacterium]
MRSPARRDFILSSWSLAASGAVFGSPLDGLATAKRVAGRTLPVGGVKALFFDVFGTLVDWRTGVAREAEYILSPLGYSLDWTTGGCCRGFFRSSALMDFRMANWTN